MARDEDDDDGLSTSLIGDWDQWGRFVVEELKAARRERREVQRKLDDLLEQTSHLDKNFAVLQLKSGGWGVIGGMLAGAAGVLYGMFHGGTK